MATTNSIKVNQLFLRKISKDLVDTKRFPLFAKVTAYMGPALTKPGIKTGETFSIVIPTIKTAEKGRVLNNIDNYVEDSVLVTVQQVHSALEFTQNELMFYLDPNTPTSLGYGNEASLTAMFSTINKDLLDLSKFSSHYIPVGTDTSVNSRWVLAKNRLITAGCPANMEDFWAIISPDMDRELIKENRNVYNNGSEISKQLDTGLISRMNGWNYSVDSMLSNFVRTNLAGDDLTINGAGQTGATINVSGITAGNLGVGENITIDGVYDIDKNTKQSNGKLKHFVIKSNNNTSITLGESIVTSGQFQNVSAGPAASAKVNFLGAGVDVETGDFGFYKMAYMFYPIDASEYAHVGNLDQQVYRDPKTGLSTLLTYWGDGKTLTATYRLDIFYAVAQLKADWSVKVPTKPSVI